MAESHPTVEQENKYLINNGNICPFCGSEEIEGGEHEYDDEIMTQVVFCKECNKNWVDIYRLVGIQGVASKEKILLVQYDIIDGEYEFGSNTICTGTKRQQEENIIDKYFKEFYGKGNFSKFDYEKARQYMYFNGSLGVKIRSWTIIDSRDKQILNEFGIH